MNATWQIVVDAVGDELSTLTDVGDIARVMLRLLLAAALGAWLGANRERTGKSAGLRTHMLVSMGCALFVMVPQLAGMGLADLSRVIQGVATGIGFLGAGTIIKHRHDEQVVGLTTAAGLWVTAAIGIACGLGREGSALVATFLAWLVLAALARMLGRFAVRAHAPPRPE